MTLQAMEKVALAMVGNEIGSEAVKLFFRGGQTQHHQQYQATTNYNHVREYPK